MLLTRVRSTANLNVQVSDYRVAIESWAMSPPVLPLRTRIGTFATEVRGVTAAMIDSTLGAVKQLVLAGLKTGVLQPAKLEQALRIIFSQWPALILDKELPDSLAHRASCHVQCVMGAVRYLKQEDDLATKSCRKHPKTGGLRKQMTSAQWTAVHDVVSLMTIPPNRCPRGF